MLADSGHEHWSTYETNRNHVISHYIDFGFHKKMLSLLPPLKYVTSERGQQPSKEHWDASQIPTHSHSTQSDLGNAAIVRRVPKLPLCLPPSPALLFFSASQTGECRHYHACPTRSQLSCRWLHMKNNETSSETRLQRRGGWREKMF